MTRVLCPQDHCVFWDGGVCGADEISLDSEHLSCSTIEDMDDLLQGESLDEWEEEPEEEEEDEWEDETRLEEEDEDDWEPY